MCLLTLKSCSVMTTVINTTSVITHDILRHETINTTKISMLRMFYVFNLE